MAGKTLDRGSSREVVADGKEGKMGIRNGAKAETEGKKRMMGGKTREREGGKGG